MLDSGHAIARETTPDSDQVNEHSLLGDLGHDDSVGEDAPIGDAVHDDAGDRSELDANAAANPEPSLATGCTPTPGVPYSGGVTIEQMLAPVWNNRDGSYRVRTTNSGTQTWPLGSSISYQLFDAAGAPVPGTRPSTAIPLSVAPNGGWVSFNATIGALPPGTWLIAWDIHVPGAGWLTGQGVCSSNFQLIVSNQPPSLTYQSPLSPGTVTTRSPVLTVTGADPDAWPGSALQYQFAVCANPNMITNCQRSAWQSSPTWATPRLQWGTTYFWSASVSDGNTQTDGVLQIQTFTVVVPTPESWRQVGNGLGLSDVFGVVLPYGVFLHRARDAEITGGAMPLAIDRTYSSGAATTEGKFGKGWLSLFDARLTDDPSDGLLYVTYPDGRQEAFGLNSAGKWISRAELGATTRVLTRDATTTRVKQATGETVTYNSASGTLTKVEVEGVGAWELTYSNGLPTRITERPSGRYIDVEWGNTGAGCAASVRPSHPYVAALTVDRGNGQGTARWAYEYNCSTLTAVTDPAGGVHRYTATATSFSATTPEGRATRGLVNAGTWVEDPYQYGERTVTVREPGSIDRKIRLLRAPALTAAAEVYRKNYNQYGGITALYCAYRDRKPDGTETCYQDYDTLEFDTAGRLRVKAKREGGPGTGTQRSWQYSAVNGRLTSMIDEDLNPVSYTYDGWGNLDSSFAFRDPWNQVTSSTSYRPDIGDPSGPTRLSGARVASTNHGYPDIPVSEFHGQYTYDAAGKLIAHDGPTVPGFPNGEQRSYAYTTGSEPAVSATGAPIAGKTMPAGLLRTETTSAGVTTSSYNERGDLTRVASPGGASVHRDYDARGMMLKETVNGTASIVYERDALGRVVREERACATNNVTADSTKLVVERTYDRDGLPVAITEREVDCASGSQVGPSRVTTHTYTAAGRVATITDAAGGVTSFEYSANNPDQVTKSTDPRGRVTINSYSSSTGQLISVASDVGRPGSTTRVTAAVYQYDAVGRKTWEMDGLQRATSYEISSDGYVLKAMRRGVMIGGVATDVILSERVYDGPGNVVSETLAGQRTTVHEYDALGRVVRSTLDPGGLSRTTGFERDAAGRVIANTLTDGTRTERTTYELNADGFAVGQSVWLDGQNALETRYIRDRWGNARTTIDPRSIGQPGSETYRYTSAVQTDALGRVVKSSGPLTDQDAPSSTTGTSGYTTPLITSDRSTAYIGYNAFGDITETRDANGAVTKYVYDSAGRLIETHLPDYTQAGGATVDSVLRNEYNTAGNLIRKTDARGAVTDFEHDIVGNVVKQLAPAVNGQRATTEYVYDATNQLTESKSPSGVRTVLSYDGLGRLVAETVKKRADPSNPASSTVDHTTSHAYDAIGNLVSTTTPSRRTIRFEHNAAGEVVAIWKPGRTAPDRFEYDLRGRVTREIDGAGRAIEHIYDAAGRETETAQVGTNGVRLVTRRTFDAAGNLTAETDPRGTTKTFTFDIANRMTGSSQPIDAVSKIETRIGYDLAGNPVRVRNGNGVDTWFTYNAWGLRTSVIEAPTQRDPALADRQWTTRYDAAGNAIELVKPGGVTIASEYDALNRETRSSAVGGPGATDQRATYDLEGRATTVTDATGKQVQLSWDDLGRLTSSRTTVGTHRFGYDADGLLTLDEAPSDGLLGDMEYERDTAGQVTRTINDGARGYRTWTATHDAATGDLTSRTVMAGSTATTTEWRYDPFGRTANIGTRNASNTVIQETSYTHDANGNVVTETSPTGPDYGGRYLYDLANRLIQWDPRQADGGFGQHYSRQYRWDKVGNRTEDVINVVSTTWHYDERNRLESLTEDWDLGNSTTPIDVDPRGNVTSVGNRALEYDQLDRLVQDADVQYEYDPLDRPLARGSGKFDYSGLDNDPVMAPNTAGTVEYAVRGADGGLLATAGRYFAGTTTHTRLALTDAHMDNTAGIVATGPTGSIGTRAGAIGFDPLGQRWMGLAAGGTGASTFGFQSDWTDPTTQVVNMGARWYDPSLGSFLSRDDTDLPLISMGALNRYGYADANPLTNHDPTGRSSTVVAPPAPAPPEVDEFLKHWEPRLNLVFDDNRRLSSPGGAPSVADRVARRGLLAIGGRLALKAVPVIGWISLAADVSMLIGIIIGGPTPPPTPPPVPPPAPPAAPVQRADPKPVTATSNWQQYWLNPGHQMSVANEGGLQVVTHTWLADLYRETRTNWSNGAWEWSRDYLGRFVTASLQETLGRVVDPDRVDQRHETPTLTAQEQVSVGGQAAAEGVCGLSGTWQTCVLSQPTIHTACAGWNSDARVCTPIVAIPGRPGGIGPATSTGAGGAGAPGPQPGSNGGGSRGGGADTPIADGCDAGNSSADPHRRPSGYRSGVRDQVWNNAIEASTGRVRDAVTGRFMSGLSPWDMGHLPGHEFWRHAIDARDRGLTRGEFLDEHNDPCNYRPELPSSNRSHRGEILD